MRLILNLAIVVMFTGVMGCFAESGKKDESAISKNSEGEHVSWLTSFAAAKAEAAKRNVPILADFSGSDWCGWCIKLDKEVFSTEAFKKYASQNLVLLLVDFPRMKSQSEEVKKQNNDLAEKLEIQGFPTVVLMDSTGKIIGRTGYRPGGGDSYVAHLRKLLETK